MYNRKQIKMQIDRKMSFYARESTKKYGQCSLQKYKRASIATYFAVGRIELRVYVLREEQRAMPAHEEPPVSPGGSFFV